MLSEASRSLVKLKGKSQFDNENVVFKPIPGASPELILLDENEKELERLDLAPLNREECNSLLSKYGFQKKGSDVESNRIRDDF
ncbi:unnamed protein product [Timema podura]|uniref:Selenoprotein F/M domain-containing protein n=1 Tax=Timema podura TaxID=61482 RepID=A0ABN7P9Q6_TIMPD|nr:unnamed protein product [Timema podura]